MSQTQRPMSLMFAQIAGNARLFQHLGEIEAAHVVDRCIKRMTRCIEKCRGKTVLIIGNEFLAVFATAEAACLAAIDMQVRLSELQPVSGYKLQIRIGLHHAPVVECDGVPTGSAFTSAARIAGMARPDEILVSSPLLDLLPERLAESASPLSSLGELHDGAAALQLFDLRWAGADPVVATTNEARLRVHYQGKTIAVDELAGPLTFGRDPANHLVVADRKASRKHGQVERRANGYFYIDTSTNGSFVSFAGQNERLLRHDEIRLQGSGKIGFGSSCNRADSDCIVFDCA